MEATEKFPRGWGHLITWNGPIMGHWNSFSASGGGNLNKIFPKSQMPGDCQGEMFKLRFDWYISLTWCKSPCLMQSSSETSQVLVANSNEMKNISDISYLRVLHKFLKFLLHLVCKKECIHASCSEKQKRWPLFYFIVIYLLPINKYVNSKPFLSCEFFFVNRKDLLFFRAVLESSYFAIVRDYSFPAISLS